MTGRAHKFQDNINTDYIIPGKYKFKTTNPQELAKYLMEGVVKDFYNMINKGDFIVAGYNFGCGSSREQAPLAIKYAGIAAVIAKSFARIFFRNSINIGLLLIEVNTDKINDKDILTIDLERNLIFNNTTAEKIYFKPFPPFLQEIIRSDGLINYIKKYPEFIPSI